VVVDKPETGFELLGRLIPDPVFIITQNGTIMSTSEGWLTKFSFKKQDVLGKSISELNFLAPKSRELITNNLATRLNGNSTAPYEVSLYTTTGEERFFLGGGCLARLGKEMVDVVRLVDITERKRAEQKLREACEVLVRSLALALEARDPYTKGHSDRVKFLCRRIAQEMNLPTTKIKELERAATLHDIGKIAVSNAILDKSEPLTPHEFTQIQSHPEKSVELMCMIPNPKDTLLAIRHHHERVDGKGYPDGLSGDDIPLCARILAVADAYDALTSERSYRQAYSHEEALRILMAGVGTQWDAKVVDAAIKALGEGQ
jgi:PAS domain S-box-containing protein